MKIEEMRRVKINFDPEECKVMMECAELMNRVFEEGLEYKDASFVVDREEYDLELWTREAYTILTQFANDGYIKFDA